MGCPIVVPMPVTRCDLLKGVAAAPAALDLGGLGASPAVAAPAPLGILLDYAAGVLSAAYGDERPESTRSEAEVPPLPLSSAQSAD